MLFKKPIIQGSKNLLGQKDRKKLKILISERFNIKDADRVLIPDSIEVTVLTLRGSRSLIYVAQGEPVLFDADGKGDVYPTIMSLVKMPDLLRCFTIHPPVSEFIMNGADLMVPGIIIDSSNSSSSDSGSGIAIGGCMGVKVVGNPVPFAVGKCLINGTAHGKGKALEVMHIYGDQLWNMAVMTEAPNQGFSLSRISSLMEGEVIERDGQNDCSAATGGSIAKPSNDGLLRDEEGLVAAASDGGMASGDERTKSALEVDSEQQQQNPVESFEDKNDAAAVAEDKNAEAAESTTNVSDSAKISSSVSPIAEGSPVSPCIAAKLINNTSSSSSATTEGSAASISLTPDVIDVALELALLETLHSDISDSNIPISTSAVFSKMIDNCTDVQFCKAFRERLLASLASSSNLESQEATLVEQILKGSVIVNLDVKKSSYKKLSKFFQHYSKEKLLQVKDIRNDLTLISVNRKCTVYKSYVPVTDKEKQEAKKKVGGGTSNSSVSAAAGSSASSSSSSAAGASKQTDDDFTGNKKSAAAAAMSGKIEVLELYHADSNASVVFEVAELKPSIEGKYYDARQCREAVNGYIKIKEVKKGSKASTIILDEVLRNCILTKPERQSIQSGVSPPPEMEMANVIQTFISRLDVYHAVMRPEQQQMKLTVRRGKMKPVTIDVEKRANNKAVTKIFNLSSFDIEEKSLAEGLQRSLAASASTFEIPGTAKGKVKQFGVLVQGRFTNEVSQILNTQYGIPDRFIVTST